MIKKEWHFMQTPKETRKMLGLITRCKDEFFIKEFVDYYLSQEVNEIFIIDDDSNDKSIYDEINDSRVVIIYSKNIIDNNYADQLYKKVKSKFKWMIYCDVDEFITTKRNINKTILEELNTTFKDNDCVKVPWVMMSSNDRLNNPNSLLSENIHRWNHDLKHPNDINKFRCRYNKIECKSIFKTKKFKSIIDHRPIEPYNNSKLSIVSSIDGSPNNFSLYKSLREEDIKSGVLLCYHYRIISIENSINKLKNNKWYIENGYSLKDLQDSDHSEIIDKTLMHKTMNNLKFLHITKTSGTYIENLASKKGILWGRNDKKLESLKYNEEYRQLKNTSFWHIPLQEFYKFPYKKGIKVFTVIRNPYTRVISECMCEWGGKFAKKIENVNDLNAYIKKQVPKANNKNFHHFLPQSLYTHNLKGEKVVDYIIRYEEIHIFNELMKKYGIDITYIKKESNLNFTVDDISDENIKLINEVYDLDFNYYNYKKKINKT